VGDVSFKLSLFAKEPLKIGLFCGKSFWLAGDVEKRLQLIEKRPTKKANKEDLQTSSSPTSSQTFSKEPHTFSKEPNILSKEPHIFFKRSTKPLHLQRARKISRKRALFSAALLQKDAT